jgi:spore germination cell wall hydrolase CwlJ-like protein
MMRWVFILTLLIATSAKALSKQDEHCLAYAVYKEANVEIDKGRIAVKDVILNRAKQNNKSVCWVIKQSGQFTYKGMKTNVVASPLMLKRYHQISSKKVLPQSYIYFFNKRLNPKWARGFKCKIVGNHKFCKEKS